MILLLIIEIASRKRAREYGGAKIKLFYQLFD
jgi:hypothetical protein